jgi:hypothetical protein
VAVQLKEGVQLSGLYCTLSYDDRSRPNHKVFSKASLHSITEGPRHHTHPFKQCWCLFSCSSQLSILVNFLRSLYPTTTLPPKQPTSTLYNPLLYRSKGRAGSPKLWPFTACSYWLHPTLSCPHCPSFFEFPSLFTQWHPIG